MGHGRRAGRVAQLHKDHPQRRARGGVRQGGAPAPRERRRRAPGDGERGRLRGPSETPEGEGGEGPEERLRHVRAGRRPLRTRGGSNASYYTNWYTNPQETLVNLGKRFK